MKILCILLTFFTGATALIYEMTWQRFLFNLIGSQAYAISLILAVFLAGLGCGYYLFGRIAQNRTDAWLLRLCGLAEIAIGLWAGLFLLVYHLLWQNVGVINAEAGVLDLLLVITLIFVPTVLMGGTLPLLTQALEEEGQNLHPLIYGTNTLGACFGSLSASFFLINSLGLNYTIVAAGLVNSAVGLALFFLAKRFSKEIPGRAGLADPVEAAQQGQAKFASYWNKENVIAIACGFYALTLQVVLIRLAVNFIGGTDYLFAIIVAAFVLLLAVGAYLAALLTPHRKTLLRLQFVLLISLGLLFISVPYLPYLFYQVRVLFAVDPDNFYLFYLTVFLVFTVLLAVPVTIMGMTLPLLYGIRKQKDALLPQAYARLVGRVYGLNTVGSVVGSLLGGFYLLYFFNLRGIYLICLMLVALTVVLLSQRRLRAILICLLIFSGLSVYQWPAKYIGIGLFHEKSAGEFADSSRSEFYSRILEGIEVLDYQDGPNTSVSILEFAPSSDSPEQSRSILVSGKSDGNTSGDYFTMNFVGNLAGLFAGETSGRAAVIGLGTGMTSGALADFPQIKQIDNIEISPLVSSSVAYFEDYNRGYTSSAKQKTITADAYRYLAMQEQRYDVVTSMLSNFWLSGIERVFTEEFYRIVQRSLTKDGVFVQWVSLWGLSPETVKITLNTFQNIFPEIRYFGTTNSLTVVAGNSAVNLQRFIARSSDPAVSHNLLALEINSPQSLLAFEKIIPDQLFKGVAVNTLFKPLLAHAAAKDFFTDRNTQIYQLDSLQGAEAQTPKTLLAQLLLQSPNKHTDLPAIIRSACGSLAVQLVEPDWRRQNNLCRDAIVAQLYLNPVSAPKHLAGEVKLARNYFAGNLPPIPGEKLYLTDELIRLYEQFNTIFSPLSFKRLKYLVSACYSKNSPAHQSCQAKLQQIEALVEL